MKKKEVVDLITLGFVCIKPMHGYVITELLKKMKLDNIVGISKTSVYNSFKRAEENGYIISKSEIIDNRPPRSHYTITEAGLDYVVKLVKRALMSFSLDTPMLFNMGMQLSFLLSDEELLGCFEKRIERIETIKRFTVSKKHMDIHGDMHQLGHVSIIMKANMKHIEIEYEKVLKLRDFYSKNPGYGKKHHEYYKNFDLSKILGREDMNDED